MISDAESLNFSNLGWTVKEARVLAACLGAATSLKQLDLGGNRIGMKGARALEAALEDGAAPKLEKLYLGGDLSYKYKWNPQVRDRSAAGGPSYLVIR